MKKLFLVNFTFQFLGIAFLVSLSVMFLQKYVQNGLDLS